MCGGERLASVNVPFSLLLHERVGEHWNTCGPEWHNNNFVSSGNDVFPDFGNTRLRLEQRTGNKGRQTFTWSLMHAPLYTFLT